MNRLLDVARTKKPRRTGSREMVLVPRVCLRCGGNIVTLGFGQLPLFRSHGYGAVLTTTIDFCGSCGTTRRVQTQETSPRLAS